MDACRGKGASSAAGNYRFGRWVPGHAEGMFLIRRGGVVGPDPLGHRIDSLIDFIPLAASRFGAAMLQGVMHRQGIEKMLGYRSLKNSLLYFPLSLF